MSSLEQLQRWLQPYAEYLADLAPEARITSVYRSYAEQSRLYRNYLLGRSQFPALPPGRSRHQYGLAWDMIAPLEQLRALGREWQRLGGRWGGERDPIHFEV